MTTKIKIPSILLLILLSIIFLNSNAETMNITEEIFSISTTDKLATIDGSITFPNVKSNKKSIPIIFIGGSYSSRDGETYVRPDRPLRNEKFWYRIVAHNLSNAGFAVVRYDNRGMASVLECEKNRTHQLDPYEYALGTPQCYNMDAVATTTFESKREDIQSIFAMMAKDKRLDAKQVIIIAHSEGTFHISRLISEKKINPASVIFLCGPGRSPSETLRWQNIDNQISWIEKHVQQNGGFISSEKILQLFEKETPRFKNILLSEKIKGWSIVDLPSGKKRLTELYQNDIKAFSGLPTTGVLTGTMDNGAINNIAFGASRLYLSLLTDKLRTVDLLKGYRGSVSFIYGKRDAVIPVNKEIATIKQDHQLGKRATIIEIDDMDHNFALPDGHISEIGINALIQEALRLHSAARFN